LQIDVASGRNYPGEWHRDQNDLDIERNVSPDGRFLYLATTAINWPSICQSTHDPLHDKGQDSQPCPSG